MCEENFVKYYSNLDENVWISHVLYWHYLPHLPFDKVSK